jgi:acylphosphatase
MNDARCLSLVVRGRVQGVGFRHFVWRRARELGLDGEVRNRPDGAVEIVAWGDPAALDRLIEQVRRGPSSARVLDLEVRYDAGPRPASGFHVTG